MMPRLLYIRRGINSCKLEVKREFISLFLLYNSWQGVIRMKMYDKRIVLKRIASLFEYYGEYDKEEERSFLDFIRIIIAKFEDSEKISISSEEIEGHLFDSYDEKGKKINERVFRLLSSIGADMEGVSFEGVKITRHSFKYFENVHIDLDKLYDKDLSSVKFENVYLTGSLEGAKFEFTDFTGYKGSIKLNPQRLIDKSLKQSVLSRLVIEGGFDDVDIYGTDFKGIKGDAYINPQTIRDKKLDGVNLEGTTLVGEYYPESDTYGSANFDGCYVDNTSFRGAKGHICINLNTLRKDDVFGNLGKLSSSDLTGVKVVGTVYCYTGKQDIISENGTCLFGFSDTRDIQNDLHNSVYYNEKEECVSIYPYRSMVKRNGKLEAIPRSEEDNLDINVIYVDSKNREDDTRNKGSFKKRILRVFKK